MNRFAVLLLAAGQSTRFGDANYKKPFASLDGRAVWMHSAERFQNRPDVCQTIVVIAPEDREEFQRKFGANLTFMDLDLCQGGATRADSVRAGLMKVADGATHVAVHDAARPCVTDDQIDRVFAAAVERQAAILATPVAATLKRVNEGAIQETVPRDGLWAAQTPQAFELGLFHRANASAGDLTNDDQPATDDAQLVERLGQPVAVVEGSPQNLKITTKDDLKMAELILTAHQPKKADSKPAHPFEDDDLWR